MNRPVRRRVAAEGQDTRRPVIGVGTVRISPLARQLVLSTLESNRLSYGPLTRRFENDFARLHDCRFGVMSNSGTSALHLALAALQEIHGWQPGDEVIVPAVTFVATANVAIHNGLRPVFVDVEPSFYELDPAQIEAHVTPRTRALVPVHLFGQPCDMDPIRDVAVRHDLKIVEDSCETMFSRYEGRSVGNLGDIGCFSTYVAHLLSTGVGGINTTNDPEYAVKLRSLMNHGRDSIYISMDDDDDKSPAELRLIIARRFHFTSVGHSFRATEMEAALGLAQLDEWEEIIGRRRRNARFLLRALAPFADRLQLPQIREGADHSFMMFPLVLRNEPKIELVNYLENHGIETREMLPLTNQPIYHRLFGLREEDYPVARWINQSGFYIGCHQDLQQGDLDYIAEIFDRYFHQLPPRTRAGVSLIITTRNSGRLLAPLLDDLPEGLFDEIVAVDQRSTDGGPDLLRRRGIQVIEAPPGTDALSLLASQAISTARDVIVFFTADGRQDPADLPRLVLGLERGFDMAIASRFVQGGRRQDEARGYPYRSIGNRLFTLLANLLFYGNFSDALSPLRAVRRTRLVEVRLDRKGLPGMYQMSIEAMRGAWRVIEIPTAERVRVGPEERWQVVTSIPPLLMLLLRYCLRRKPV